MATITPALTLKANASSASTPGPMSFALSLSATDDLDVTKVETKILDVKIDHATSVDAGILWDASDYLTPAAASSGTDGGFVYIKNTSTNASHEIMIGTGAAKTLNAAGESQRLMTLKGGEFAFFPWDMALDIIYDSNVDQSAILESWLFVRTGTA